MSELLRYDERGLVPVVVQDKETGQVLMLAYMDAEALEATQRTGKLYLRSRSRGVLWLKGETSGHYQLVDEIRMNCEGNSLLALVRPQGPACHDGYATCFYRRLQPDGGTQIVAERLFDPEEIYGAR
jgi:phosphoribosyl-AMP cyclohydrolase